MTLKSLQDTYSPEGICFGCGCANTNGLQIKSYVGDSSIVCSWSPEEHHQAFPGILNGGIIGSVLDCHSNWSAAYYIMQKNHEIIPPCTVTAEYKIKLHRPTPVNKILNIAANLTKIEGRKAWIDATLSVDEKVYASCSGLFVAVKKDHPAYHRW